MDPFKAANKLGIPTIIFGVLVLILGWLITATGNPLVQLQLGEVALVFLSLFFYSLLSDKIAAIEEGMKVLSQGKREAKAKLVP